MLKKLNLFFLVSSFVFTPLFGAEGDEVVDEELIAAVDNLGPTADGYLGEGDFGPEDENFIDPHVLRDFIESRGLIEARQKEGKLTIAGDVRARWVRAAEKVNGDKVRGQGTNTALDRYKSEVNLFFDYVAPRGWLSTKLKWVNFDGKDGGTATRVEMDRAFIGYDVYKCGKRDFYIEVGRSKLDYMFESRVQYTSTFDGIHLYYTDFYPGIGTFTVHGGPFLMDSFTNDYSWIAEAGIRELGGTGFLFKYSFVDWKRKAPTLNYGNLPDSGTIQLRNNPRYRFMNSQMLLGYKTPVDFLGCKTLYIYGASVLNHDPLRTKTTDGKKLNSAWYVGFTLGKLCKACDWSVDINYQSVQAQAVPEYDLAGIGHGNAGNTLLSDAIIQGFGPYDARGFTNYKGWQLNGLYALTESLSLRAKAQWSTPRNKSVGGDFRFKSFEMSAIYAF